MFGMIMVYDLRFKIRPIVMLRETYESIWGVFLSDDR